MCASSIEAICPHPWALTPGQRAFRHGELWRKIGHSTLRPALIGAPFFIRRLTLALGWATKLMTDRLVGNGSMPRRWSVRLTLTASSVLGLGYAPVAPGTWGTLAGLPLWWAMRTCTPPVFSCITALCVCAAVAVASRAEKIYGAHDVQRIVIDEVVGLLCTVIGVPWRWPEVVAAFVLFRLLDALKPPPISWFDAHVPGGLGVVIDDVVAGLIGCVLLHLGCWLHGGWF